MKHTTGIRVQIQTSKVKRLIRHIKTKGKDLFRKRKNDKPIYKQESGLHVKTKVQLSGLQYQNVNYFYRNNQ